MDYRGREKNYKLLKLESCTILPETGLMNTPLRVANKPSLLALISHRAHDTPGIPRIFVIIAEPKRVPDCLILRDCLNCIVVDLLLISFGLMKPIDLVIVTPLIIN